MDTVNTLRPIAEIGAIVLGLVLGSFANVCIYRMPRQLSVVGPRSRCPACERWIPWYDNIPILSFLLLKGRCRSCGARISFRYPMVECGTALASWLLFLHFGLSWPYLVYFLYAVALITLSVIDIDFRIIPDRISLSGFAAGLVLSALTPWLTLVDPIVSPLLGPAAERLSGCLGVLPASVAGLATSTAAGPAAVPFMQTALNGFLRFTDSLAGALIGGGFLLVVGVLYEKVRSQEGIGGGDIKLLAMVGAFTGWQGALFTIFGGSLVASVVGVGIMIRRKSGQIPVAFGPYLSVASLLYVLAGDELIQAYLNLVQP